MEDVCIRFVVSLMKLWNVGGGFEKVLSGEKCSVSASVVYIIMIYCLYFSL